MKPVVVAIDGPSGVGKTTVAGAVSRRLGLPFLETGAMYRAAAWKLIQEGADPEDRAQVESLVIGLDLALRQQPDGEVLILLDGKTLDARIRAPEVSEITSKISTYPGVRQAMVRRQRDFATRYGAVMEGRDIGSQVFPDTPFKFFLTASLEIRVSRRLRQLEASGQTGLSRDEIEAEVTHRDLRDSQREDSPLQVNGSYTVVDTSARSVEEIVELIVQTVSGAVGSDKRPG